MKDLDLDKAEPRIIKTQDEDGEIHSFELIDVVNVEGRDYGLLIHLDEEGSEPKGCGCGKPECEDDECEDDEVVIMRLDKEGEAYTFETIEDDEEFNKVIDYLENEADFDEDEDEDEDEEEEEA